MAAALRSMTKGVEAAGGDVQEIHPGALCSCASSCSARSLQCKPFPPVQPPKEARTLQRASVTLVEQPVQRACKENAGVVMQDVIIEEDAGSECLSDESLDGADREGFPSRTLCCADLSQLLPPL